MTARSMPGPPISVSGPDWIPARQFVVAVAAVERVAHPARIVRAAGIGSVTIEVVVVFVAVQGVLSRTTPENVVALVAEKEIIADFAVQGVLTLPSLENVMPIEALELVVSRPRGTVVADDVIGTIAAAQEVVPISTEDRGRSCVEMGRITSSPPRPLKV